MRIAPSLAAVSALALALAACGDNTTDDVVQQPAAGAAPVEVTDTQAEAATAQAAVALGMTRQQLEDADLISSEMTDLGDVETLVLDPAGAVSHVVVELEGADDINVSVPIAQVRSHRDAQNQYDLQTDLTAAQLQALPRYTGPGA